jgi:hypothetical protein
MSADYQDQSTTQPDAALSQNAVDVAYQDSYYKIQSDDKRVMIYPATGGFDVMVLRDISPDEDRKELESAGRIYDNGVELLTTYKSSGKEVREALEPYLKFPIAARESTTVTNERTGTSVTIVWIYDIDQRSNSDTAFLEGMWDVRWTRRSVDGGIEIDNARYENLAAVKAELTFDSLEIPDADFERLFIQQIEHERTLSRSATPDYEIALERLKNEERVANEVGINIPNLDHIVADLGKYLGQNSVEPATYVDSEPEAQIRRVEAGRKFTEPLRSDLYEGDVYVTVNWNFYNKEDSEGYPELLGGGWNVRVAKRSDVGIEEIGDGYGFVPFRGRSLPPELTPDGRYETIAGLKAALIEDHQLDLSDTMFEKLFKERIDQGQFTEFFQKPYSEIALELLNAEKKAAAELGIEIPDLDQIPQQERIRESLEKPLLGIVDSYRSAQFPYLDVALHTEKAQASIESIAPDQVPRDYQNRYEALQKIAKIGEESGVIRQRLGNDNVIIPPDGKSKLSWGDRLTIIAGLAYKGLGLQMDGDLSSRLQLLNDPSYSAGRAVSKSQEIATVERVQNTIGPALYEALQQMQSGGNDSLLQGYKTFENVKEYLSFFEQPLRVQAMQLAFEMAEKAAVDVVPYKESAPEINREAVEKGTIAYREGVRMLTNLKEQGISLQGEAIADLARVLDGAGRSGGEAVGYAQAGARVSAIVGAAIERVNLIDRTADITGEKLTHDELKAELRQVGIDPEELVKNAKAPIDNEKAFARVLNGVKSIAGLDLSTQQPSAQGQTASDVKQSPTNQLTMQFGNMVVAKNDAEAPASQEAIVAWSVRDLRFNVQIVKNDPVLGEISVWNSRQLEGPFSGDVHSEYGATVDGRLNTVEAVEKTLNRFGIGVDPEQRALLSAEATSAYSQFIKFANEQEMEVGSIALRPSGRELMIVDITNAIGNGIYLITGDGEVFKPVREISMNAALKLIEGSPEGPASTLYGFQPAQNIQVGVSALDLGNTVDVIKQENKVREKPPEVSLSM